MQRKLCQPYIFLLAQFFQIPHFYDDKNIFSILKSLIQKLRADFIVIEFFKCFSYSKDTVYTSLLKEAFSHGSIGLKSAILDVFRTEIREKVKSKIKDRIPHLTLGE